MDERVCLPACRSPGVLIWSSMTWLFRLAGCAREMRQQIGRSIDIATACFCAQGFTNTGNPGANAVSTAMAAEVRNGASLVLLNGDICYAECVFSLTSHFWMLACMYKPAPTGRTSQEVLINT